MASEVKKYIVYTRVETEGHCLEERWEDVDLTPDEAQEVHGVLSRETGFKLDDVKKARAAKG
jgi:hypothetical protein